MKEQLKNRILEVTKLKKILTLEETKEYLEETNHKYFLTEENSATGETSIMVDGDLSPNMMFGHFYLNISYVTRSLFLKNKGLHNLKNVPSCGGDMILSGNKLKTVEYFPSFGKSLDLSHNKNLLGLDFLKKEEIEGYLDISFTSLKSLKSLANVKKIKGDLVVTDCGLNSLSWDGEIGGNTILSNNMLTHEPKIRCLGTIDLEGNPCNPADGLDEAMW